MKRAKRIAAWVLAGAMVLSNNSFAVLAEEAEVSVQPAELTEEVEEIAAEELSVEEEAVVEEVPAEEEIVADETAAEGVTEDVAEASVAEADTEEQIIGDTDEIVLVDDAALFAVDDDAETVETVYEYWYPEEYITLLPGHTSDFGTALVCWVVNEEYPDGTVLTTPYTSVEVKESWYWEDGNQVASDEIVEVVGEDGYWYVVGKQYGEFKLLFKYTDLQTGEEAECTSEGIVNDVRWGAELHSGIEVNKVLPGFTNGFYATAWRDGIDENDEYYDEDMTSKVTWKWEVAETDAAGDYITLAQDGSDWCDVTVADGYSDYYFVLRAIAYYEDNAMASADFYVDVAQQFYRIDLDKSELQSLQPGQETTVNPTVYNYEDYSTTEVDAEVIYRWEWDENALQITDADGNVLTGENPQGSAPFTVKKLNNDPIYVQLYANLTFEDYTLNDAALTDWNMWSLNYGIWYEELREGDGTWIYNNEDYTLTLNTENLQDKEDVEIFWEVGRYNEEKETKDTVSPEDGYYTVNEDGSSITLHGSKLAELYAEGGYLHVWANVLAAGIPVDDRFVHVDLREAIYDYQSPLTEPGERDMLIGWDIWIDNKANVYVEDGDHPWGEDIETSLNVEVLGQYTWDDEGNEVLLGDGEEPVVEIEENEYGWNFRGNRNGFVLLKLIWASVTEDGEYVTYGDGTDGTFEIWVNSGKNFLNLDYPDRCNLMMTNDEMEVQTSMRTEWRNDDGSYDDADIEDYYLAVDVDEDDNPYYNTDLIDVEIVEDKTILVKSKGNTGGDCVYIKAFDLEGNEIGSANLYVNVVDCYYKVVLLDAAGNKVEPTNPLPGATLDLDEEYTIELRCYNSEDHSITAVTDENFRVRLASAEENGFNSDVLQFVEGTEEELIPTIQRIGNGGTHLRVIVEHLDRDEEGNESWNEWESTEYYLNGYNYDTRYDNLRGGDWGWIFTDEENLTVALNTDNLMEDGALKEGVTIEWAVGKWNHDAQQMEDQISEEDGYFTVNGTEITLHGDKLAEKYAEEDNKWLDVQACVYVEGTRVSDALTSFEVRDPEYRYDWPFNGVDANVLMPGWVSGFGKEVNCWVRNVEHPDGEDVQIEITGVEILGWGDEFDWEAYENGEAQTYLPDTTQRVTLEGNAEEGWCLCAEEYGYAHIQFTYIAVETGEEATYDFPVFVTDQRFELGWDYLSGTDCMLKEDTMTVATSLYSWIINEDGEWAEGNVEEYTLSVANDDGTATYDDELVQVEVDGTEIKITSKSNYGETDIWVRVFGKDKYGDETELCGNSIHVNVYEGFCIIEPKEAVNPYLQEELNLNDLNPAVYETNEADGTFEIDGVRYRIEYDSDAWDVKAGTEEDDIPVLIRKGTWGTSVCLIAMQDFSEDGSGDWQEITRRDYWFDDITGEYQVDYIYSYGSRCDGCNEEGTTSHALTDIPLVLTLDETRLHGLEGFDVDWKIWIWDDEAQEDVFEQDVISYVIAEDGRSISLTGNEDYLGKFVHFEATVYYEGQYLCGTWTHVKADYCEHEMDEGVVAKAATCTTAGTLLKTCKKCGAATETEPIAALGHTGGTATCTKAAVCTRCKQSYGSAKGHNMGAWTKVSDATVFNAEQQKQTCKNGCGYSVTKSVGNALTPTITLTDSKIVLQVKKSTTAFTISGLAKGDSIKSITLDSEKYVKISNINYAKGTFKLTAQKTKGKATLTIVLASNVNKKYTVPITVQTGAVKTTKLTDTNTTVTLAKKGAKLKVAPSRVPFTSADKIKYTVKNKKVAKVASNGTITAVAPGKTTVTAKAGKGKITYNVVVKGIALSKTSITVKKGKTTALKTSLYGISGTPTFKSSNTAVATVDANGKVTGIKKGSATITVTLNGYTAKCKIKVK